MRQPPRGYPWIERCDIGDRHTLPPPFFSKRKYNQLNIHKLVDM